MAQQLIDDDILWEIHQKLEDKGHHTKWTTFRPNIYKSFGILRKSAEKKETHTYKELGERTMTDYRKYLSIWLRGINYHEEQLGRPPLSVLVVTAKNQLPADGFFEQMEELDYFDPNQDSKEKLTYDLQDKVFRYW